VFSLFSVTNEAEIVARPIKVSKLTEDFCPHFRGFDKFAIKEINQDITFSRAKSVLPQLDDGTAKSRRLHFSFPGIFSHD
jgi:hypothetical protein